MTDAEYPGAIWIGAASSSYRVGRPGPVTIIVPHCTDGHSDPRGTAQMFATPGNKTTAHFIVGQDATIIQCVRLADTAEHAHAANGHSIAIEHCARSPREWGQKDTGMAPTEVQLAASARLCAWLCERFGLQRVRSTIQGHAECDPLTTHADCPEGCGFNLDDYVALVRAVA